jgi:hypothetical protein
MVITPMPMKYVLIFIAIYCLPLAANADLAYQPFRFELKAAKQVYEEGDPIEFTLRITNTDKVNAWPVMVPGAANNGKKLIFLTAYTVGKKGFYTEVARENSDDPGSGPGWGGGTVKQLAPGASLTIRFKLSWYPVDSKKPSERHWIGQPLKPGEYQFLAWYHPYGNTPFDLYHYTDVFKDEGEPGKLSLSKSGTPTQYCRVIIKPGDPRNWHYGKAERCSVNCRFCRKIKKGKWAAVERIIDRTTQYLGGHSHRMAPPIDTLPWLQRHARVTYLSSPPSELLASLPTWYCQTIGFAGPDSIHHFKMVFQIGKIFPVRSRIQSLIHYLLPGIKLFKTSTTGYVGLRRFTPQEMPE